MGVVRGNNGAKNKIIMKDPLSTR